MKPSKLIDSVILIDHLEGFPSPPLGCDRSGKAKESFP